MDINRRDFLGIAAIGMATLATGFNPIPQELFAGETYEILYDESSPVVRARTIPFSRQKELAGFNELPMITNRNIDDLIREGHLIKVPRETETYYLDGVREKYAIATPYNKLFLDYFTGEFHREFQKRFGITSLSRTWGRQLGLIASGNQNAASPWNSGHVRGISIDFNYRPLRRIERSWVGNELAELQNEEVLSAVRERNKRIYHTMIFKNNFLDYYVRNLELPVSVDSSSESWQIN